MNAIARDLRYGARRLLRTPGYTLATVATLALGIGANCAIFSALNAFLLRPLPFAEPGRLVHLFQVDAQRGWNQMRFSMPVFLELRRQASAFEGLAAYDYVSRNLSGQAGEPQRLLAGRLSSGSLELLGVEPLFGRGFEAAAGDGGRSDTVLLSYGLWQSRYAGDRDVLGRQLRLNGVNHTVVGVMAQDFQFPYPGVRLWVPLELDTERYSFDNRRFAVFGRLGEGQGIAGAERQTSALHRQVQATNPVLDRELGLDVVPLRRALIFFFDMLQKLSWLLMAAVFCILLIACSNVANLQLARSDALKTELAVRSALGASRRQLLRQMLTESLLLALAGGAVGLVFAYGGLRLLTPALPEDLYRVGGLVIDSSALVFTLALSLLTAMFFGLVPALQASRPRLAATLKEGGPAASGGRRRFGRVLVIAQLSLAVILLIAAALMIQSFGALQRIDPGLDSRGVVTMGLTLAATDYPEAEQISTFYHRALERVEALPGVESAAAVYPLPLNFDVRSRSLTVPGDPAGERFFVEVLVVTPRYFETMGIPVLSGRTFDGRDRADGEPVVVINEKMAQRLWPEQDPVDRGIRLGRSQEAPPHRVVGVVGDVRQRGLNESAAMQVYIVMDQEPTTVSHLVVKSASAPMALVAPVRREVWSVDPNLPIADVRSMDEVVSQSLLPWEMTGYLLGALAAGAALLAAVGLSGLVAYAVARRSRELAIRMAIGAERRDVLRLVLADSMRLTVIGLAVGVPFAVVLTLVVRSFVPGIHGNVMPFLGIPILMAAVAWLASYLPARRASRIEPIALLRVE